MREYTCPCCGVVTVLGEGTDSGVAGIDPNICGVCFTEPADHLVSVHTIPVSTPICKLEARQAFAGLTDREKFYAYWMSQASWNGALICLSQTSPESIPIFCMLHTVFSAQPIPELLENALLRRVTEEEIDKIMIYCATFFSSMGNYKSFGDTKFVPQVPLDRFRQFLLSSNCNHDILEKFFDQCKVRLYSLTPRHRQVSL